MDKSAKSLGPWILVVVIASAAGLFVMCGGETESPTEPEPSNEEPADDEPSGSGSGESTSNDRPAVAEIPDDLPNGLLLSYAQFPVENGRVVVRPIDARLEILTRRGGQWQVDVIEDAASNVFHKAMVYDPPDAEPGILTMGGTGARVSLWRRSGDEWAAEVLWEAEFGGELNRMRDAEVADLFGDQRPAIAVATHDQGVVAVIRQGEDGYTATELDRQANRWVHEIEIGDLNGDGTLEVYATPSEPNQLDGTEQRGQVVRYVPRTGEGRTVVADLGARHAKEIWVGDVDGDGRDELYVAVEAVTRGRDPNVEIVEPVEIRRYEADTPADQGVVIATIQDRLCRFLTVGDVDGDGRREMFAAAFSSGVWMLQPGRDANQEWSIERIDPESSGFEHASIAADLDGDGTDELYVAADDQGELRRYAWVNGRPRREVIHRRDHPTSQMTWNIMPVPRSLLE